MSLTRRQVTTAAVAAVPLVVAASGTASAVPRRERTLYIAGDSTAAQKYAAAAPETGWGMALPFFLHSGLNVSNHAVNGRSSKSFIDEGRLDVILDAIRPGDLLLIQFGHNDSKVADPTRYTEPWTTYQDYLRQYIDGARARGARPVLATSVERRKFDADGVAQPTHGDYPASMRALAEKEQVALLDIQALSIALWQRLGVEETKKYFNWTETEQDNTHFNPPGAIAVARLVATELLRRRVVSRRDVRRLDEAIPESWITWPEA
ncbi:rhamnogalacturonan acetylesterase [Streptomyces ipomoeae]|uniref:GDSL-like protein n=1 Tax=Streptomyces ipomoeae 91-03 TaxID=698759 RepID=L1KMW8_9ACTN|nr:rhamnogalacturonan acetylesterase [Streptomyces ipomoeae]EKX61947.1 GDSL-like protein [Streptomyces ipomoeae 91-03]MDX2692843.1 rhamnogalacturonan acetylesterase [Streptomyces ipomoeae]MDX2822428.1 rhamnogalacturonan acetylesterase [Streptomyces ipomoeae]MDX2840064.1 rhamnogalacturonan acetylesterase [Streptomyces ipomoeae]MDX2872966.1 rhamnogalacturonan acetylesterase [Streptomyces ipomoeae]